MNDKLAEIVLRVARSISGWEYDDDALVELVRRFLAAWQEGQEPVAWMCMGSLFLYEQDAIRAKHFNNGNYQNKYPNHN